MFYWEIYFFYFLGLFYFVFIYYMGFKVNFGEYKLMGLVFYGELKYVDLILDNLLDLKVDGMFCFNMVYFNYVIGFIMINKKFVDLFGVFWRLLESLLI